MRRPRLLLAAGCSLLGFLAFTAVNARPADPAARLSRSYRLADLIEGEQRATASLRREVVDLRARVEDLRSRRAGWRAAAAIHQAELTRLGELAGLEAVRGPGVRVVLDDSERERAHTGNVNDLVIHSQDVQAVVNAMWRAGAEAVAINGQRLVATSAVLCVGNTLLLNGTVHSPPYTVSGVGAERERFETDALVRRLHDDATAFGLRFSVTRVDEVEAPPYRGATGMSYARPVE